ncbi:B12-binding domain-containing radical SAM protein [Prochlorococcus sp. MIT 1341]|uniref:B12-binding domain-containing radical SAM protein n=1 Tax=Prochlorococcus sp. MIT 1341 TaxID=3096221 RepID=UPI002A74871C|nr:radical SAM protein [Prochlorococcus sp. MIT 1341]
MNILFITTPIRPRPTDFAPIGVLSILQAMRKNGINNFDFYNIDAERPSYEDALNNIISRKPDIFVISAVVSTAYEYTKRISNDVRAFLPNVLIVLGGNMAASAEIILKKTEVDVCVTGEGEITNCNIFKQYIKTKDIRELVHIRGIVMYLDNELINTGYEEQIPKEDVYDVNWNDLEKASDINQFFYSPFNKAGELPYWLREDSRAYQPHRRDKLLGQLAASKGCVSRCTFCHRWTQGMRYIPFDILAKRIEELIEKYNMGFLDIVDENFGTDKEWLEGFCAMIKKYDLLWRVSGIRVTTASPDKLQMMKRSGCISATYGMETGSSDMLKVMEKRVRIEDNYNAIKWTIEAGLHTSIQLVLGMPGETTRTIKETSRFVQYGMSIHPDQNPSLISINYAQALPGTPLYEYARHHKMIGQTLAEEEQYLLEISDRNASDTLTTLNFTNYPKLECETWRLLIAIECNHYYLQKYGFNHYKKKVLEGSYNQINGELPRKGVIMSLIGKLIFPLLGPTHKNQLLILHRLIKAGKIGTLYVFYPRLSFRLRRFLPIYLMFKYIAAREYIYGAKLFLEYFKHKMRALRSNGLSENKLDKSLRSLIKEKIGTLKEDSQAVKALRVGR